MPLLDHFRPPIFNKGSWEGFHGGWPMTMLMDLCKSLPEQYTAEAHVHLGKNFEVHICTFDVDGETSSERMHQAHGPQRRPGLHPNRYSRWSLTPLRFTNTKC